MLNFAQDIWWLVFLYHKCNYIRLNYEESVAWVMIKSSLLVFIFSKIKNHRGPDLSHYNVLFVMYLILHLYNVISIFKCLVVWPHNTYICFKHIFIQKQLFKIYPSYWWLFMSVLAFKRTLYGLKLFKILEEVLICIIRYCGTHTIFS